MSARVTRSIQTRLGTILIRAANQNMKLIISLVTLAMIAVIACGGGSPKADQATWDAYEGQIDFWRVQVSEKLAEADKLLVSAPTNVEEWRASLTEIGIELDSITFAVGTIHPPEELLEFHGRFVLASDFYKLIGRMFTEFTGTSEADRSKFIGLVQSEITLAEDNMVTAQVLFDEVADKR